MSDSPPSHEKAVLICRICGRTAPMDDEWEIESRGDRTDVTCPDCGTVIVSQPEFDGDERTPLTA